MTLAMLLQGTRQTCLKQNASCLLLVAEAKLSNFGISGTSIWKTTSVEIASGILLAVHLAERTEAITWVVNVIERLMYTVSNTPSLISLSCVMRWFLKI